MNLVIIMLLLSRCKINSEFSKRDEHKYFILKKSELNMPSHNLLHEKFFSKHAVGYNNFVLQGIDKVQSTTLDGGGYFIGLKADPPESPIGYDLEFMGNRLIKAPRSSSYCSGASYTALIEALNLIYKEYGYKMPDSAKIEALRMQELDGSRREDHVKYWGKWNADGFGNHFALVQYSKMGKEVTPAQARPGDFANISWKSGNGHSVIFLCWAIDEVGEKYMYYWSSQKGTNGLGDQLVSLKKIKSVKIVRLVKPDNLNQYNPLKENIELKVKGDAIEF